MRERKIKIKKWRIFFSFFFLKGRMCLGFSSIIGKILSLNGSKRAKKEAEKFQEMVMFETKLKKVLCREKNVVGLSHSFSCYVASYPKPGTIEVSLGAWPFRYN